MVAGARLLFIVSWLWLYSVEALRIGDDVLEPNTVVTPLADGTAKDLQPRPPDGIAAAASSSVSSAAVAVAEAAKTPAALLHSSKDLHLGLQLMPAASPAAPAPDAAPVAPPAVSLKVSEKEVGKSLLQEKKVQDDTVVRDRNARSSDDGRRHDSMDGSLDENQHGAHADDRDGDYRSHGRHREDRHDRDGRYSDRRGDDDDRFRDRHGDRPGRFEGQRSDRDRDRDRDWDRDWDRRGDDYGRFADGDGRDGRGRDHGRFADGPRHGDDYRRYPEDRAVLIQDRDSKEHRARSSEDRRDYDAPPPAHPPALYDAGESYYRSSEEDEPSDRRDEYNCTAEMGRWQVTWGDDKKFWCCRYKDVGCQPEPYTCEATSYAAQAMWDDDQIEWCCKNKGIGCQAVDVDLSERAGAVTAQRELKESAHAAKDNMKVLLDAVVTPAKATNS